MKLFESIRIKKEAVETQATHSMPILYLGRVYKEIDDTSHAEIREKLLNLTTQRLGMNTIQKFISRIMTITASNVTLMMHIQKIANQKLRNSTIKKEDPFTYQKIKNLCWLANDYSVFKDVLKMKGFNLVMLTELKSVMIHVVKHQSLLDNPRKADYLSRINSSLVN